MVTIATFFKPEEAHLLRMRLEAVGIPAHIQDENTVQLGQFFGPVTGGVRVQVDEQDVEAVRKFLAEDQG